MSVGHIIFKEANIPMSKNEAIAIYKKAEKDIKAKEADFAASREEHEDQHEEEVQAVIDVALKEQHEITERYEEEIKSQIELAELDIKKIDDTDERALQAAKDRFENEVHRLTDNREMRIQKLEGNISELQATIDQDRSAMERLKKRVLDSSVPDDGPPLKRLKASRALRKPTAFPLEFTRTLCLREFHKSNPRPCDMDGCRSTRSHRYFVEHCLEIAITKPVVN